MLCSAGQFTDDCLEPKMGLTILRNGTVRNGQKITLNYGTERINR